MAPALSGAFSAQRTGLSIVGKEMRRGRYADPGAALCTVVARSELGRLARARTCSNGRDDGNRSAESFRHLVYNVSMPVLTRLFLPNAHGIVEETVTDIEMCGF